MSGPDASSLNASERWDGKPASQEVELVGPHLRVRGSLSLGRFPQLADLVNHDRGFIVMHDAQLSDRGAAGASLAIAELVVNQDEVTFIGHDPAGDACGPPPSAARSAGRTGFGGQPGSGVQRELLIFTPGHTIRGGVHLHREMTLTDFAEATDPRFLTMRDATAGSLLDPDRVTRYPCMLVNRTQINAIAEVDGTGGTSGAGPGGNPR